MAGNKYSVFYNDFWKFREPSQQGLFLINNEEVNENLPLIDEPIGAIKNSQFEDNVIAKPIFQIEYCRDYIAKLANHVLQMEKK